MKSTVDYKFKKKVDQIQKLSSIFLDEINFGPQTRGKSKKGENVLKKLYIRRVLLASIKLILPENPNEICEKILLLILEKEGKKIVIIYTKQNSAINGTLLEYK